MRSIASMSLRTVSFSNTTTCKLWLFFLCETITLIVIIDSSLIITIKQVKREIREKDDKVKLGNEKNHQSINQRN